MNAAFVDSSVWIDYFRGAKTAQALALDGLLEALDPDSGVLQPTTILLGDLVLAEVLRGIVSDTQHDKVRSRMLGLQQVTVGGTQVALAAADHYRALRHIGITVRKTVDCLIAAWCITRDVPLLHSDRDFEPFVAHRGLRQVAC